MHYLFILILVCMNSKFYSSKLNKPWNIQALFLDCDGTIAETEVTITLAQFNQAFQVLNQRNSAIPLYNWSEKEYEELLKVGDSKKRYLAYYEQYNIWPDEVLTGSLTKTHFSEIMQTLKNDQFESVFSSALESGRIQLRPGIKSLVDTAISNNIPVAVCSNSNYKPVAAIVEKLLGYPNIAVYGGDQMKNKKPYPDIYHLAATDAKIKDYSSCLVIEDSYMGLSAAKAAGMKCVITKSRFTHDEDFSMADLVCDDLVSSDLTLERLNELLFSLPLLKGITAGTVVTRKSED